MRDSIDAQPGHIGPATYEHHTHTLENLMLGFVRSTASHEATATLKALDKSQAIIEFRLDGTIIAANANFLDALGYTLAEVQGKHHGMFLEPWYRESAEYRQFWERLNRGEYQAAQFKRIGKGGREVRIEASYNPILDGNGKPFKVVKFSTDVTRRKAESSELKGQVEAIDNSQGVISFALDGTVQAANDKFLAALGYTLEEIKGRHHSMSVEPAYRESAEYRAFWAALNRGEYQAGQFKRIGKGGREVWIEASYNPMLDPNAKPFKVVKFATNITAQIETLDSLRRLMDRNFGEIDLAIE
ncbi:MAG TPA: PAS domain-containing protein [Acetobacteraceae bacterium]|nr:PAS domain-containing protein [Acetobacteraceae bacterium]